MPETVPDAKPPRPSASSHSSEIISVKSRTIIFSKGLFSLNLAGEFFLPLPLAAEGRGEGKRFVGRSAKDSPYALLLDEPHTVPIGIAREKASGEAQSLVGDSGYRWRNHPRTATVESSRCGFGIGGRESRLPVPQIIGTRIFRSWATIARREIVQEFYTRSALRPQPADVQARPGDIVQLLLLQPMVHTHTDESKPEYMAIKFQTLL